MEREIEKSLMVSTAHITEAENQRLAEDPGNVISVYPTPYGYRIHVPLDPMDKKVLHAEGYPSLPRIFEIARAEDCAWIHLDCDVIPYDDLEEFDW